jgi:hypothetical protein
MGKNNRLLAFDTTWAAQKTMFQQFFYFFREFVAAVTFSLGRCLAMIGHTHTVPQSDGTDL